MKPSIELSWQNSLSHHPLHIKRGYAKFYSYPTLPFATFVNCHNQHDFMLSEFSVSEIKDVKQIHIKKYIRHCQQLGMEKQITINGSLSTLRVLFNYLVDEEFIDEFENPLRRIKNLKEEKRVIRTFNDDEVQRILSDVAEETYSNISKG